MTLDHAMHEVAPLGHSLSLAAIVTAFLGILPALVATIGGILAICWYCIVIRESRTFQHWNNNRKQRTAARRLAKLRAAEKVVLAKIAAVETVRAARVEANELVKGAQAEAAALVAIEASATAATLPPV